jgi:hypothetical protein
MEIKSRSDILKELHDHLALEFSESENFSASFTGEFEGKYKEVSSLSGYFASVSYYVEFTIDGMTRKFHVFIERTAKKYVGESVTRQEYDSSSLMDCLLWIDQRTIKKDNVHINYDN